MINPLLSKWYKFCPSCQQSLRLTGNSAKCSRCGFTHYFNPAPTVSVVVTKVGQILIVKRAIEPKKGWWDLPGGFVNMGESGEDCVLREVAEETNLEVKIERFLGTAPDVYDQAGKPTLNLLYWAKYVSGVARAQDDVAKLTWVSWADLPQNFAFENCRIALKAYAKIINSR